MEYVSELRSDLKTSVIRTLPALSSRPVAVHRNGDISLYGNNMLIGSSSTMAVPDGVSTEPGDAQPSLYVAKCVLRSSAVLQAVYGHIRSPSTLDLVFGKVCQQFHEFTDHTVLIILCRCLFFRTSVSLPVDILIVITKGENSCHIYICPISWSCIGRLDHNTYEVTPLRAFLKVTYISERFKCLA